MTSGRETCFGSRMDRALWTVIVREALGFSPVAADGGNGFRQHTGAVSRGPRARSRGSFSREVLDQQGDPGELPHPRPQRPAARDRRSQPELYAESRPPENIEPPLHPSPTFRHATHTQPPPHPPPQT